MVKARGYDPQTSGLWAQLASTMQWKQNNMCFSYSKIKAWQKTNVLVEIE